MQNKQFYLSICDHNKPIPFILDDDPLKSVLSILSIIDEETGNYLNYPFLITEKEYNEIEKES